MKPGGNSGNLRKAVYLDLSGETAAALSLLESTMISIFYALNVDLWWIAEKHRAEHEVSICELGTFVYVDLLFKESWCKRLKFESWPALSR